MKLKRAVIEARQAWRVAARQLDEAIGIEILDERSTADTDVLNVRRFRRALLNERETRLRYAAALKADHKPIPEDLLWDIAEEDQP
jgi:hypothetical protein